MSYRLTTLALCWCVAMTAHSDGTEPAGTTATTQLAACLTCHGDAGQGIKAMGAPKLANLDAWYIERQLRHFRDGVRGTDPMDTAGAQMRASASALSDDSINSLSAALAARSDTLSPASFEANAMAGKGLYAHQCGACHGPSGIGNEIIGAPRIAGLDDWYALDQLQKFTRGVRGGNEKDRHGSQMVFVMSRNSNEAEHKDIIAYLRDPAAVESMQ
ncbi:MAG: cytochrome c [Pseudomonadales bacterium]